jgi:hypothetical protein
MIDFPNGSLVTPEGVVILGLFRVGVMDSREDLVPQGSIAVCVRRAMRGGWAVTGKTPEVAVRVMRVVNTTC